MAKLTKDMLRSLIVEMLEEELDEVGEARPAGQGGRFETAPTAPIGRPAHMQIPGTKRKEGGGTISSARHNQAKLRMDKRWELSDDALQAAVSALWHDLKAVKASIEDLSQDTTPTAMSPASGAHDVPRPAAAATVKTAATKFHEEPTAKVAENRKRRIKRR